MGDQKLEQAVEHAIESGEIGFQVAAYLRDECIVDIAVGSMGDSDNTPVTTETLFPIFSVTKAFLATAVHMQAERGYFDVDLPLANYWPEFAQNGKGNITIRHVLTHRSGVPHMPPTITAAGMRNWDAIVEWIATVTPVCSPGERSIYHSISFGHLLGELLRRTDPKHRLFGSFLQEEFCEPLGITDLFVGLPQEHGQRVATLVGGTTSPDNPPASNYFRELSVPPGLDLSPAVWNDSLLRQVCIPAAGGITNARSGARFFQMIANGGSTDGRHYLNRDTLLSLTCPRPNPLEVDAATGVVPYEGVGGFQIGGESPPAHPVVGIGSHVLHHPGAGGSIGWADLDTGLAVMITHNRMFGAVTKEQHPFIAIGDAIRRMAS